MIDKLIYLISIHRELKFSMNSSGIRIFAECKNII